MNGLCRTALVAMICAVAACAATYPEGTLACKTASDCPAHWSCRAQYCFSEIAPDAGANRAPSKQRDAGDRDAEESAAATSDSTRGRAGTSGSASAGTTARPPAADSGSTDPADDAGTAEPETCGDTQRDPRNCGRCGHVCLLANAEPACAAGRCIPSSCAPGYADCDAQAANGCETALDSAAHCGACGTTCETSAGTVRSCQAGSCLALELSVGPAEPVGTVHGSIGGDVYTHMCPSGEVLTGIELASQQSVNYGFNAKCAAISLAGTWDQPQIALGPAHRLATPVGGFIGSAVTREPADCPPDTVVTGSSGSLIVFQGETRLFIKSVLLACSRVSRITPDNVVFVPAKLVPTASASDPGDGSYSDTCGPGQVITGFTGYAGAAIDGLQTHCSSLTLQATSSVAAAQL